MTKRIILIKVIVDKIENKSAPARRSLAIRSSSFTFFAKKILDKRIMIEPNGSRKR